MKQKKKPKVYDFYIYNLQPIHFKKSGNSNGIKSNQLVIFLSLSLYKKFMLEVRDGYKHPRSSSNRNITKPQTRAARMGKPSHCYGNNFLLYKFEAKPKITLLITYKTICWLTADLSLPKSKYPQSAPLIKLCNLVFDCVIFVRVQTTDLYRNTNIPKFLECWYVNFKTVIIFYFRVPGLKRKVITRAWKNLILAP